MDAPLPDPQKPAPHVGLFVTCLVDLMRPSVGFAAVKLLEDAGCRVAVPAQTCCGQPAYNMGDRASAKSIARATIEAFEGFDFVVAPSGSCAGMLAKHYPELFADEPAMAARAEDFAAKCREIVSFLVDDMGVTRVNAACPAKATYHDSCSGLREMGVKAQPRALLATVDGLTLTPLEGEDVCCGFGGTFAVKYGELSGKIVEEKCGKIAATGADLLLAGDLGCLLNMAGRLSREGRAIKARHVIEVLAGIGDTPAIGEAPEEAKP